MMVETEENKALTTRIDSIERMRRDFVASVSHELRTPLTVIHGYMEVLIDRNADSEYLEIYKQIFAQSKRMKNLVADLLLLSKLESTELSNTHAVNVPQLIQTVVADMKVLFENRSHEYQVFIDESLSIEGDDSELQSVFANLVQNACHYSQPKGLIQIAWFQSADGAIFEVKDSGLGIDEKHLPRLTERFYRVDKARSRNSGGTGLGLAIVKHALMRHNGELEITSELGKGSCFRAIFPLG